MKAVCALGTSAQLGTVAEEAAARSEAREGLVKGWRKLRVWAAEEDTSMQAIVGEIVRRELAGKREAGILMTRRQSVDHDLCLHGRPRRAAGSPTIRAARRASFRLTPVVPGQTDRRRLLRRGFGLYRGDLVAVKATLPLLQCCTGSGAGPDGKRLAPPDTSTEKTPLTRCGVTRARSLTCAEGAPEDSSCDSPNSSSSIDTRPAWTLPAPPNGSKDGSVAGEGGYVPISSTSGSRPSPLQLASK